MEEYWYAFVEDAPSAAVLKKLVAHQNQTSENQILLKPGFPIVRGGVSEIRKNAGSYLKMAAKGLYTLVFVDLDSVDCAPALLHDWFSFNTNSSIALPERLIFRVAVREIESWIMADRSNLAGYLRIPIDNFPLAPDDLDDPKREVFFRRVT